MNCGDFRYLIQRRFDIELSPPDDRSLLIHLETCESCQKFYHQVQQVIIAAEELDLPEELVPPRPEFLANKILDSIPQSKPGINSLISGFLARLGLGPKENQTAPPGVDTSVFAPLRGPTVDYQAVRMPQERDSLPAAQVDSLLEEQRTTRSLGQKFGLPGSTLTNMDSMSQPQTLADSIRQKIAEMSKANEPEVQPAPIQADTHIPSQFDNADTDLLGEWTIPHSPEWTKISSDVNPEEWTMGANAVRAPNNWGESSPGGWTQPVATPPILNENASLQTKPQSWSIEAEQLETGNWQTVQFDTAISAAPPALPSSLVSAIPSVPSPPASLIQAEQHAAFTTVDKNLSEPVIKRDDDWELSIQEKLAKQRAQEIAVSEPAYVAPVTPPIVSPAIQTPNLTNAVPVDNNSALFSFDDHAIDKLFSENLGVHEKAPQNAEPISPPLPQVAQQSGLFTLDDGMIDRIFSDNLGITEQTDKNISTASGANAATPVAPIPQMQFIPPAPPAREPVVEQPTPAVMDQNSLANSVLGKQKIIGIGRLDTRPDTANEAGSGRIASIGKFLLDNNDLEKIGKLTATDLAESKMRTLTSEANDELKSLLNHIDSQQGVIGSVIFGHDGLLIANTMPPDIDAESFGVSALGVFMGTSHVAEKLGNNGVRQIVSKTDRGYLVIANFGAGLLITLTHPLLIDKLLPLMRTITQLVAN